MRNLRESLLDDEQSIINQINSEVNPYDSALQFLAQHNIPKYYPVWIACRVDKSNLVDALNTIDVNTLDSKIAQHVNFIKTFVNIYQESVSKGTPCVLYDFNNGIGMPGKLWTGFKHKGRVNTMDRDTKKLLDKCQDKFDYKSEVWHKYVKSLMYFTAWWSSTNRAMCMFNIPDTISNKSKNFLYQLTKKFSSKGWADQDTLTKEHCKFPDEIYDIFRPGYSIWSSDIY